MNFFKRAALSVWARKSRSLLVVTVFAVIGVLVLTGLSIQSASDVAKVSARKQLGGTVTLMVDVEKVRAQAQQGQQSNEGGPMRIQMPSIAVEQADMLKDSIYIKGYNYVAEGSALANNFEAIKNEETETETETQQPPNGMGTGKGESRVQGDVSLEGVVFSDAIQNFVDNNYTLIEGRHIEESDLDKHVVMIEKQLADANELAIGDSIQLKSVNEDTTVDAEVVGIFQSNVADDERASMFAQMSHNNKMYMPYTAVNTLKGADYEGTISSAVYYVSDPIMITDFLEEGQKTNIDFDTYKLDANNTQYEQMIGPIENVSSFSKNIVFLVSIAGAIILMLIVMLSIKERRNEIGILLALGEKKHKVITQFVVEIVCMALIGFSVAGLCGNVVATKTSEQLLQQEIKVTEQSQQTNVPTFGKGQMGVGNMMNQAQVDPISELDVSVTANDLLKLSGIGLLLAILAVLVPAIQVVRLQPRTILSRQE